MPVRALKSTLSPFKQHFVKIFGNLRKVIAFFKKNKQKYALSSHQVVFKKPALSIVGFFSTTQNEKIS